MEAELLARLEKMAEQAARACCVTKPNAAEDTAYQFGRMQGKYSGISECLSALRDLINEQFEEIDEKEEA